MLKNGLFTLDFVGNVQKLRAYKNIDSITIEFTILVKMMRNFNPMTRNVTQVYDEGLRNYMVSVFSHMSVGLLLTAIVAYSVSLSPELLRAIHGTPLHYIVIFAPIGVAIYFSIKITTLAYETARALFYSYAFLIGLSFSFIFELYTGESIAQTFLVTSATFGSMSLYGYTTKTDLTKFGSFLIMGLMGLIISMIVNLIFFRSSALSLAFSAIAVLLFTGLTAFDVQHIKMLYRQLDDREVIGKKALYGAFALYLDFINLFIHLLRFFGSQRR